jgi:hypothetical protein
MTKLQSSVDVAAEIVRDLEEFDGRPAITEAAWTSYCQPTATPSHMSKIRYLSKS